MGTRVKAGAARQHRQWKPVTSDEVESLANSMPPRLRAAVIMAAYSGLRFGELFALARHNVDLYRGEVRVERSLSELERVGDTWIASIEPWTAEGKARSLTVKLPAIATNAIGLHMVFHTGPGPLALVFTNRANLPYSIVEVSKLFRTACHEVGRTDLGWHDLRRNAWTLRQEEGVTR
jgi:integrase